MSVFAPLTSGRITCDFVTNNAQDSDMSLCVSTVRPPASTSLAGVLKLCTLPGASRADAVSRSLSRSICYPSQRICVSARSPAGGPYRQSWAATPKFQQQTYRFRHASSHFKHHAFIALGSNMGDRVAMIETACKEMEASGKMRIVRTSSLWETKAMYVLDQDKFVNGACEVSTELFLGLPDSNTSR